MEFLAYSLILIISLLLFLSYRYFVKYRAKLASLKIIEKHTANQKYNLEEVEADEKLLDEAKELIHFHNDGTTVTIQNEIFRLQNLLNEVYGLIEPMTQEKQSTFLYDIDMNMPIELIGDSLLLEQILYNLLSHTLHATESSNIIVSFKKIYKNNEHFIIEIMNTQHSITDKDIETFNMHCSENETNTISALCSAKKLIEHMEGTLSITDQTDGTYYTIELPFLYNEFYQETHYTLPSNITEEKILWVEDNKYAVSIINKMLHYLNLDITIKNTHELTELKDFERFDMIIIDMKYLTPLLTRELEEIKVKKELKVISLETFSGTKRAIQRKNKFIDKYLYKPFTLGMVYELLYDIYVVQVDETSPLKEDHTTVKRGEIIFIEETPDIARESFQDFNHIHVLVVEDNRINQKILQSVLERSAIKLTIANHGQEALTFLEKDQTVNIILMDINMPIMDGYEASRRIRQIERLKDLPIVVVSGLGFRNEIEKMYLAGANAHLTKPFKIGQLYNAFQMFLSEKIDTKTFLGKTPVFREEKSILDVEKGISNTRNILRYRDTLREILVMYRSSDESVKELIIKKEMNTLYQYCRTSKQECEKLGLTGLSNVHNEMIILMTSKEEQVLQKYVLLYKEEWLRTKRNIELYLKSVDAY
jgi:CheY-like chemotaxis protein